MNDLGQHCHMVQAASPVGDLRPVDAKNGRQVTFKGGDLVAHANECQLGKLAVNGGADPAHRVGKIEHRCVRCDLHDRAADFENRRNDPQAVEQAPRPAILTIDLMDPVLLRDLPVEIPQGKAVANLDRYHNEIGAAERVPEFGLDRDLVIETMRLDMIPGHRQRSADGRQVDVIEDDLDLAQRFGLEDVTKKPGAKLKAAGAHKHNPRHLRPPGGSTGLTRIRDFGVAVKP